jgi:hypothetical protein
MTLRVSTSLRFWALIILLAALFLSPFSFSWVSSNALSLECLTALCPYCV